jgi:hypothetical protein
VYRIRGPPELDADALAASVMGMVRSKTLKTGFFHEVLLQGMSSRDILASIEKEKALGKIMRSIHAGLFVSPLNSNTCYTQGSLSRTLRS